MNGCTAIQKNGSRCGVASVVRDFRPALYPDGPAIRLCDRHTRDFQSACVAVMTQDGGAGTMENFELLCDEWRFGADCVL